MVNNRWGDLHEYRDLGIYEVDHGWYAENKEKTSPWLVWNPSKEPDGDTPEEVRHVNALQENGNFLQGWKPFRERIEEQFTLSRFFLGSGEDRREPIRETAAELTSRFDLDIQNGDHLTSLTTLKTVRDESRQKLDKHAKNLEEEIMSPLQNVLIPCAVEARRNLTEFSPIRELNKETQNKWLRTVRDLHHLWYAGIGGGISWNVIHKHKNWYGRTFQYVPNPVARGAKIALKAYVEQRRERYLEYTRDAILNRAEPVYLKWEAARLLIGSALYDWTPSEVLEKISPDIFEGRPTLRNHAAEIVEKYRSDPGSLPKGRGAMGNFKEKWVPDSFDAEGNIEVESNSKVNLIQREVRKAGLSDEYSDGNPESFCDLVERLLKQHDTAKS